MRGRKPKPTNLRLLNGNAGKRPINQDEPKPSALTKMPAPPAFMRKDRRAVAKWRSKGAELIGTGVLTVADLDALAQLCVWHSIFAQAEEKLAEPEAEIVLRGETGSYMNTLLAVMSMAQKHLKALETEFGMTPSSRTRIKVQKVETDDADERFFGPRLP